MTIRADRITFKQNADNSMSATAYGNPVTFRQKRDGVDEYYEGFAQRVEYDGAKDAARAVRPRAPEERQRRDPQQLHLLQREDRAVQGRGPPGRAGRGRRTTGRGARVRGVFQPNAKARTARRGKAPTTRPRRKAAPRRQGRRRRCRSSADDKSRRPPAVSRAPQVSTALGRARCSKRYKSRTVVHDVSLDGRERRGRRPARPNGAGKTTCFYMIVGLVAADGGDDRARRRGPVATADPPARAPAACRTCRRKRRSSAS